MKMEKINRNKFILKIIDEHFQQNQDLLNELQQLKEIIKEIKIIDFTTKQNNNFPEIPLDIEEKSNSSSISLTKEELNQLNNPMF